MSILLSVLFGIVIIFSVRFYFLGKKSAEIQAEVGLSEGKLLPCPNKPNCVCSFYKDERENFIEPLVSSKDFSEVKDLILRIPRSQLVAETPDYVYFTFTSGLFGFVDDLELLNVNGVFHVRSASRVGHSDLGVNRKRVETIRKLIK